MGTQAINKQDALDLLPGKMERVSMMLCSRIISEPWSFHKIAGSLSEGMIKAAGIYGRIIAECKKQFDSTGRYTPQSLSIALNYGDPSFLLQLSMEDSEADISFAFALFLDVYGQTVAYDIWLNTPGWLTMGMTGEEIAIESDRIRRESGAMVQKESSDGKMEFEEKLCMALEGKIIDYPVRPHLANVRKLIRCYEGGDYIVVGALSGVGKTYYAIGEVYACSMAGIPSCLINLENTPMNMQKRMWQKHCGEFFRPDMRSTDDITRKRIQAWEEVKKFLCSMFNPGRALPSILSQIRQEWHERGIKFAAIDYAQKIYIPGYKGPRNYELDRISAELRELALELNIPVLALAQFKQEVSKTNDKRGGMYDIKDCAGFAQDATIVKSLHRPSYFNISEEDGIELPENYADVSIVKGRETGTALAKCSFDPINGFFDTPAPDFSTQFPATTPPPEPDYQSARPGRDQDVPF